MTYSQAREYIEASNQYGSKLGLKTITELMKRLGNPQDTLKLIHVAGTNGKGSTTAFIASILTTEGYRVGRYISPAVFSYRERIQIGTQHITEQGVADTIAAIKPVCEAMVKDGLAHPTSFELETAMAFLYFAREQVDFAVIEVGLGGRLDATNVINHPILGVITTISMDHMQYLGNSLKEIATEKAGIIKKGVPVVTGNTAPEVINVIENTCVEKDSELIKTSDHITKVSFSIEGTKFTYQEQNYEIKLLGEHQIRNAVLAIEAVKTLQSKGYEISDNNIIAGLKEAVWGARLEVVAKQPYFILDGAHNEDAAIQLTHTIMTLFPDKKRIFIMGVLADKEYKKILEITAPLASIIITLTPANDRALNSSELAREAEAFTAATIINAGNISDAIATAYAYAAKEDILLAFGSLSYLGALKEYLSEFLKLRE